MTTDRSADDESSQNIAERLIDRVSDATERMTDAGHAIVEEVQDRVEQLTSLLHREEPTHDREEPTHVGKPIPVDVRPVRPKGHASPWLAWRDNRWVPVHRVKDVGWVWSE
jgi:hypothetical protein